LTLYALTLWPEWAYAITDLGKRVENRTWTRESMLGQDMAIHAGAKIGGSGGVSQGLLQVEWMNPDRFKGPVKAEDITTSAIVAVARVASFVQDPRIPWAAKGQWQWVLDNVRVLSEPVSCSGRQGLWKVNAEQWEQILPRLGK